MSIWFEIVLTIYGFVYLFIKLTEVSVVVNEAAPLPELSEEMRSKIYI